MNRNDVEQWYSESAKLMKEYRYGSTDPFYRKYAACLPDDVTKSLAQLQHLETVLMSDGFSALQRRQHRWLTYYGAYPCRVYLEYVDAPTPIYRITVVSLPPDDAESIEVGQYVERGDSITRAEPLNVAALALKQ